MGETEEEKNRHDICSPNNGMDSGLIYTYSIYTCYATDRGIAPPFPYSFPYARLPWPRIEK